MAVFSPVQYACYKSLSFKLHRLKTCNNAIIKKENSNSNWVYDLCASVTHSFFDFLNLHFKEYWKPWKVKWETLITVDFVYNEIWNPFFWYWIEELWNLVHIYNDSIISKHRILRTILSDWPLVMLHHVIIVKLFFTPLPMS